MSNPSRAAEIAARDSYGRLLAFLSSRTHDIAMAEDALADAFAKALSHWPEHGIPQNPDAWLLTAARNKLTDNQRHQTRFPTQSEIPEGSSEHDADTTIPDERLSLLMVCAHPSIAPDIHVPLMLQTVLGMEAKTIAHLFLVSPAALAKRLVRAKTKIRDAGIPFKIPDDDSLPDRSMAIFEAIYALHAHDWLDPKDAMGEEALYLADLLCRLMPGNAEALGLAALIALSQSRANARIIDNQLIPTHEQDPSRWNNQLIQYGSRQLRRAYQLGSIGRFQIEAAIEAAHIARKDTGKTDWAALNKLYFALQKIAPSAGALVAQAAITGRLHGPKQGLDALEQVEQQVGSAFQPLWASRAEMHAQLNENEAASRCYRKALSLTTDGPTIKLLNKKLLALEANSIAK
ncbi:RNA polymerase sigma factor [Cohaesibacter gelatinilyticus]|uniref:RNA polymerase sigma-70 factor, ECF subfamily n=1 Tax=Cohaesibacter gelatinilyticus TaxID=372072 RepID=A0A285PDQ6_9HYPH|nr:DUF6596 domain-containing protein [Cohaesibacter gelatinilyticus]SNZ19568.1 RNA polymerase sigma-70 factor, ECF subfamily [Cohaesibacter gelatinilyticus]